eukprot:1827907-Rhodomonas_salina.2
MFVKETTSGEGGGGGYLGRDQAGVAIMCFVGTGAAGWYESYVSTGHRIVSMRGVRYVSTGHRKVSMRGACGVSVPNNVRSLCHVSTRHRIAHTRTMCNVSTRDAVSVPDIA